jgi:hypothetical protein
MENTQAQTVQQQEINLNFTLTVNEANLVITALRELPHRVSDDLIRKVVQQAQSQVQNQQQGFSSPPPAFYENGGKTTQ